MNKLIMLAGVAGSGKSYVASKLNGQIFSSDAIRKELYGDESVQENPAKVFEILRNRIVEYLREGDGRIAIYDATNIRRDKRIAFLNSLKRRK